MFQSRADAFGKVLYVCVFVCFCLYTVIYSSVLKTLFSISLFLSPFILLSKRSRYRHQRCKPYQCKPFSAMLYCSQTLFFSIYEWTALYTTDSVLLNTKLPQGFELLVYITWAHVGISRYMFLSAPWFLWILIFVLLTNEGVDNRRNEGNIPFSAAL